MIELGLLPLVIAGIAIRAIAGPPLAAPQIIFGSPLDVIGDQQVEITVFVVIEPSGAGGPSTFIGDSGLGGDIGKRAVAIVVIQNRAAVAGDIQVGVAVVIEIADRDALPVVTRAANAGRVGNVGERSVAVVVIQG